MREESSWSLLSGGEFVFHDMTTLHHEGDVFENFDVLERIVVNGDEVGEVTRTQFADVSGPADEIGGADGSSLDGLRGAHAVLHHVVELLRVVAVRVNAGVRAEGHLDAGLEGFAEVITLGLAESAFLGGELFRDAEVPGFAENVGVVVDVHDEVGAVLLGEADAFIVDKRGVLDGIDTGFDRPFDALCAVGVGGDLAASLVGGIGRHLKFGERVLRRAGLVALREDAARSEDLDDVDAVLDLLADGLLDLLFAISNLEVTFLGKHCDGGLRRIVVEVTVTAGDGDAGAGGDHARAGMKPASMFLRRSTARKGGEPTSRTEVKPASRVFFALTTPAIAESKGEVSKE